MPCPTGCAGLSYKEVAEVALQVAAVVVIYATMPAIESQETPPLAYLPHLISLRRPGRYRAGHCSDGPYIPNIRPTLKTSSAAAPSPPPTRRPVPPEAIPTLSAAPSPHHRLLMQTRNPLPMTPTNPSNRHFDRSTGPQSMSLPPRMPVFLVRDYPQPWPPPSCTLPTLMRLPSLSRRNNRPRGWESPKQPKMEDLPTWCLLSVHLTASEPWCDMTSTSPSRWTRR